MGHVGSNRSPLVQDLANSASRHAKQLRKLVLRQSGSRQDILAQNLARMRNGRVLCLRQRPFLGQLRQ